MNAFRMYKSLASVIAILFTLGFSVEGRAQAVPAAGNMVIGQPTPEVVAAQTCSAATSAANQAWATFNKTCGDAKLRLKPNESCKTRVSNCQQGFEDAEQEEDESSSGGLPNAILAGVIGVSNVAQTYAEKGCPDMTASEGREKERDLKQDIKDREREIDDTKKEIVKLQKDTSDKLADLNKQVAELDEDFKKAQSEMSEQEIAAAAEARKAQSEASQAIQDLTKNILTKEKQLAEAVSNKAAEMSKFTDFVIKNQCEVKIKEEVAKQIAANKKKGSSQSLAKINNLIKSNAKQGYSECVNTLVQSRNKVRLQFDNAIKTLEEDIAMARQSLADAQSNLKELEANIEKAKQVAQQKGQDAYAAYLQKRQNLAQEIQMLSQNSASESKQLESKLMQLNMDLNNLRVDQSNFLASGRGGSKALDDIMGDYNSAQTLTNAANAACKNTSTPYVSPEATQ